MFDIAFTDNPIFARWYFMLEMAGINWLPAPHASLIARHAGECAELARLRDAPRLQRDGDLDSVLMAAAQLRDDAELAAFIAEDLAAVGIERPAAMLIAEVVGLQAELVPPADAAAATATGAALEALLDDALAMSVRRRLGVFFHYGAANLQLGVIRYPLAAASEFSFGILTGHLQTLGIHPEVRPERILGVVTHGAVHAWAQPLRGGPHAAVLAVAETALATAIGAWTVRALTGHFPEEPWTEDRAVDRAAHAIYDTVATGIGQGRRFVDVAWNVAAIARTCETRVRDAREHEARERVSRNATPRSIQRGALPRAAMPRSGPWPPARAEPVLEGLRTARGP